MTMPNPSRDPSIGYVRALLGVHADRMRAARQRKDAGASVIELAIITAALVLLAIAILAVITSVVNRHKGQISKG